MPIGHDPFPFFLAAQFICTTFSIFQHHRDGSLKRLDAQTLNDIYVSVADAY